MLLYSLYNAHLLRLVDNKLKEIELIVDNDKDLNAVEIENGIDIIEIYEENNQIYHFNIDS